MARRPLSSRPQSHSDDRHLIAEQPGMALLLTGFLIALFVGLVFRAGLSPARVRNQIEKAAAQIHRDVQVQFENAEVSLSDGILPRFSILITNVVMESQEECWMSPRLETNQIRLPLSVWGLLSGGSVIREIEADQVKLTLRGDYRDCGQTEAAPTKSANGSGPAKLITMDPSDSSAPTTNSIGEIYFATLEVDWVRDARARLEFQNVDFKVRGFDPRWYVLQAKTALFKDDQVGDYLSHANLYVEYKESPEPTVQAHFFGNWREGHYSFVGNYDVTDESVILESDLKHIPLSQIIQLAQHYDWANPAVNPKNIWLSLHSSFAGKPAQIMHSPWDLADLRVEGDVGDIRVDRVSLQSLDPLRFDDIRLDLQKVSLEKVLDLFIVESPGKIFGHLGQFTGRAEVSSREKVRILGDWSGLEFIFSNKGQREIQRIRNIRTDAGWDRRQWKLDLSHIEPEQGVFNGTLQMSADSKWKDMDLRLRLDEAILAPSVQKLMTQDGEIGAIASQLDFSVLDGRLAKLKGNVKAKNLNIEGVALTAPRAQLDFAKGEIAVSLQGDALKVSSKANAARGVVGFLQNEASAPADLLFTNFAGQFRTLNFRTLIWKNASARYDGGRLSTEGGWDDQGRLQGSVQLKDGHSSRQWQIGGTREVPAIVERTGGH